MIVIRFGRWSSESGKKWIYTRIFSRRWGAVKRCVFFWRKYWSENIMTRVICSNILKLL